MTIRRFIARSIMLLIAAAFLLWIYGIDGWSTLGPFLAFVGLILVVGWAIPNL